MKKYFCLSDIHSFYNEMRVALKRAGFNKTNKDHILIVCGDAFDRGPDAIKVYKFLRSIPKSRRILIKGNHEDLYFRLLDKSYPEGHDFHNCTVDTLCQIASSVFEKSQDTIRYLNWCNQNYFEGNYVSERSLYFDYEDELTYQAIRRRWSYVTEAVKKHPITKWLKSKDWVNYYELDKYIFVHSFIPVKLKQEAIDKFGMIAYGFENPDYFEYDPEWRKVEYWGEAIWGCPWSQYKHGLFLPEEENGKVLVCGHWHTSDFYHKLKGINTYRNKCAPIYYSKGLIGLDGGLEYDYFIEKWFHPQNVMVIEESDFNTCYDQYKEKLTEPEYHQEIIRETVTIHEDGTMTTGMKDFIE